MSTAMGMRLVHNLSHPTDLIIDLAAGPHLARAIIAARRRSHLHDLRKAGWGTEPATLIVTGWPAEETTTPVEFLKRCRNSLLPGGCVAVLLPHDAVAPVDVVIAAKQAGLAYLQHIVATDRPLRPGQRIELDIHTDVLILTRSARDEGGSDAA
ncbi:hypothetical protein B0I29_1352 [Actinoplanes lutulentus]|uniref:Uncharacterized protein n=2 Tax=Actinoplanes lutulentus TaxID=1287878 RepID=A0A327YVI9_9ACTN|nr:hypothetical protein B0I29_1352 [Actinoplanes lutulentus]